MEPLDTGPDSTGEAVAPVAILKPSVMKRARLKTTRRSFLKAATVVASGMPALIPATALGKNGSIAPSNRIVLGGIGLGPRGRKVLEGFFKQ